jgi:hypothetical protein
METKKDNYINVTGKTRPICGNYELSAVITKFAKELYDQKDLDGFTGDSKLNTIINPTDVALQLLINNVYGAYISRDDEVLELKDMYVNYNNIELLTNYFDRQKNIIKRCIIDRLEESSTVDDNCDESDDFDEDIENILQFDEEPSNFDQEIDFDDEEKNNEED